MTTKDKILKLIEMTGDPLAPLVIQDAYMAVDRLGLLMAPLGKADRSKRFAEQLMNAISKDNDVLTTVSAEPDFIVAVAMMLCEALVSFGQQKLK